MTSLALSIRNRIANPDGHLPTRFDTAKVKDALASPRLRNRMRVARFPLVVALVAFAFASAILPAPLLAKQEKKHVPVQHAASHPNAHPESQSKKRNAEAKKRMAEDKKQLKKAERAAKNHQSHPSARQSALRSGQQRPAARGRISVVANSGWPGKAASADPATASRVHAWVDSQKGGLPKVAPQTSTDPHTATSADFVNAANSKGDRPAAQEKAITGTSAPPPDRSPAEPERSALAKPVSVISVVRTSAAKPQLPAIEDLAAEPVILPTLYTRRGRLVVPPPLKGSHEILLRQNQVADDEGLDRIQDDVDLDRMRGAGLLIAIPSDGMLHVDERLPANRRYCRPWTALFLDTLARQHYARFQTALQLTSAVRTVEFQQQLIHRNGNAAPAEGDTASPHLTGQAIDLGKKGLSMAEIAWLRGYLLPLVQQGKVDVEEEFQQSCFHISVYKNYLPRAGAGRRSIAGTRIAWDRRARDTVALRKLLIRTSIRAEAPTF